MSRDEFEAKYNHVYRAAYNLHMKHRGAKDAAGICRMGAERMRSPSDGKLLEDLVEAAMRELDRANGPIP